MRSALKLFRGKLSIVGFDWIAAATLDSTGATSNPPTYSKKSNWSYRFFFISKTFLFFPSYVEKPAHISAPTIGQAKSISQLRSTKLRIFVKFDLSYFCSCSSQGWEICPYVRSVREPSIQLFARIPTKSRPTHLIHPPDISYTGIWRGNPLQVLRHLQGKLRKLWGHNFSIQTLPLYLTILCSADSFSIHIGGFIRCFHKCCFT